MLRSRGRVRIGGGRSRVTAARLEHDPHAHPVGAAATILGADLDPRGLALERAELLEPDVAHAAAADAEALAAADLPLVDDRGESAAAPGAVRGAADLLNAAEQLDPDGDRHAVAARADALAAVAEEVEAIDPQPVATATAGDAVDELVRRGDRVGAAVAVDRVDPRAGPEPVGAVASLEPVLPGAGIEPVPGAAAGVVYVRGVELVVTGSAGEPVRAALAVQGVGARIAPENVVPPTAGQRHDARPDPVALPGFAVVAVALEVGVDRVPAAVVAHDRGAVAADRVAAVGRVALVDEEAGGYVVGPRTALDAGALQRVVAQAAVELVSAQVVVARVARDGHLEAVGPRLGGRGRGRVVAVAERDRGSLKLASGGHAAGARGVPGHRPGAVAAEGDPGAVGDQHVGGALDVGEVIHLAGRGRVEKRLRIHVSAAFAGREHHPDRP